ncbi:MAG: hypothetical protein WCQ21_03325 [Verrucomicrobiota bacterium]
MSYKSNLGGNNKLWTALTDGPGRSQSYGITMPDGLIRLKFEADSKRDDQTKQ